jgi:hypothetical protein
MPGSGGSGFQLPPRGACRDITSERARQIAFEGYDEDHDDKHAKGELTVAAICYLRVAMTHVYPDSHSAAAPVGPPSDWPFSPAQYKPDWTSARGNLVKAGALIAAEIDRLDRQGA